MLTQLLGLSRDYALAGDHFEGMLRLANALHSDCAAESTHSVLTLMVAVQVHPGLL